MAIAAADASTLQRFNALTIHVATAIGSIVVQRVAKSLLILINRGDMGKCAMAF